MEIIKKWKIEPTRNSLPGEPAYVLFEWHQQFLRWDERFAGSLSDCYAYRQLSILGDVDLDLI